MMSLNEFIQALKNSVKHQLHSQNEDPGQALAQWLKPKVPTPLSPIRRIAEPLIAAFAVMLMVSAGGMGLLSLLSLALALGFILMVLKVVFGIDIDLNQAL